MGVTSGGLTAGPNELMHRYKGREYITVKVCLSGVLQLENPVYEFTLHRVAAGTFSPRRAGGSPARSTDVTLYLAVSYYGFIILFILYLTMIYILLWDERVL